MLVNKLHINSEQSQILLKLTLKIVLSKLVKLPLNKYQKLNSWV